LAGLTPEDGILGNKTKTEDKPSSKGDVGSSPLCLNAAQEESGEMPSAILHKDLRFKDGLVEIAGCASQIQPIHKEQKRQ